MKIITEEKLMKILENHKHWLEKDCDNWENMRANLKDAILCDTNLCGADLREAILCGVNLCGVNLSSANLRYANLRGANLDDTNLCSADLRGANLRFTNLCNTDLSDANLTEADLSYANLSYASLRYADLSNTYLCDGNLNNAILYHSNLSAAILRGANLNEADLRHADLKDADLKGANLYMADLKYAKNIPFIPMTCPDKGSFIGYKKAVENKIVELQILEDSKRSSATGRKCRCDKARVLSITNLDGTDANIESIPSGYDSGFIYTVGEIVEEPNFDENRWIECTSGIHFFINRQEAVDYV